MQRLDIHFALEACDIVIESATIVAILALKTKIRRSEERQKQRMSCRGLTRRPAAHFVLVRFYGFGRCAQVERLFQCTHRRIHLPLLKQLWFPVDEVVHHDDVMAFIVVWTWGNVAGLDPDRSDAGVIKHNAEEGQASVARRGWDETAE